MAGENDHIEAAPIGSRQANYAVVDRIRDLAKWLIVTLGAIGGVLLTGSKLSDIGATHGGDRIHAELGVALAVLGAAAALWFIARVLLPIRLTLPGLEGEVGAATAAKEASGENSGWLQTQWRRLRWPFGELVNEEERILGSYESIEDLRTSQVTADEAERKARTADGPAGEVELKRARENREAVDEVIAELLAYALAAKVRWRMWQAGLAVALGAGLTIAGIVLFSIATHSVEDSSVGEAVAKRPSAVTVELSAHGQQVLAEGLGEGCSARKLEAVALGGEPDALDVVSIRTPDCEPTRFTLTGDIGVAVNELSANGAAGQG